MADITPSYALPTMEEEVVLPQLFQETPNQTVGGWAANAQELKSGQVSVQAAAERILMGNATAPLSGVGVFIGKDVNDYEFRAGDPAGQYLHWDGSSLTIVGTIVATAGTIGGFSIGADYIRDVGNSMGLASTVTGGNDVRFWAGDTFANRATAPFNVKESGLVTASNIVITGGSVDATILSGIVNLANLNVAVRGWSQTCAFSITDADTIAWGAGSFVAADGTTYAIGAGNTGNMVAKTYIYLDTAISTTAYQTTTTAGTAVGAGKVLIAIAQNATGEATYQVLAGMGGQNIDAANIVAGSITANEIAASTITAGKMSVSQLSAIVADMGAITAGTIVLTASGYIRSGQTDYNTGAGFFLGISGGATKFSIGDPTGRYLTWDGSSLTINGYVVSGKGAFGGDGSDGALAVSSGTTTIDLGSASKVVKNYTSIAITGTGAVAFSNPHANGTKVIFKSQGVGTFTSSAAPMLDLSGIGATAGVGNSGVAIAGTAGTIGNGDVFMAGAGGGGGASGAGNTGGTAGAAVAGYTLDIVKTIILVVGGGGGGGGSGATQSGNGGRGGGAMYMEIAGAFNFTTAGGISVAGKDGANGVTAGNGGGGGGAGSCVILYNTLTANSGTITVTGGAGGTRAGGANQGGGGGGGGSTTAGTNPGNDTGTAGVGGAGFSIVSLNNFYA